MARQRLLALIEEPDETNEGEVIVRLPPGLSLGQTSAWLNDLIGILEAYRDDVQRQATFRGLALGMLEEVPAFHNHPFSAATVAGAFSEDVAPLFEPEASGRGTEDSG